MRIRSSTTGITLRWAFAGLLAVGLPADIRAQNPAHDSSSVSVVARGVPMTAAERQVYVGIYTVSLPQGEQTTLTVYEKNGVLMALPGNQDESQHLIYQGNNIFLAGDDPNFALVFIVENGRATKFSVHRDDGLIEGVRSP